MSIYREKIYNLLGALDFQWLFSVIHSDFIKPCDLPKKKELYAISIL